jgi:hypothetical protein
LKRYRGDGEIRLVERGYAIVSYIVVTLREVFKQAWAYREPAAYHANE